jgi:NADH dehydrogenase FAD-containing subunit
VLVRGAGVVGVEVAAELATLGKKVTLACHGGQILPRFAPKVQRRARPYLIEAGVKIVDSDETIILNGDFDLVYDCTGNTFPIEDNTLNKNFPAFRDEKGRVRVNEFFQICDENFSPIPHIFAVGDCCITQANEEKNIPNLQKAATVVTHNLKELAKKGKNGRLSFKRFPKIRSKIGVLALISLGRSSLLVLGRITMIWEFLTKIKKGFGPKTVREFTLKEKRGK